MKKWRVLINGTNFRMVFLNKESEPRLRRMGFITVVFVTARTSQDAELRAVAVLRRDKELRRGFRNEKNDPPVLFCDEIQEITSFHGCHRPRTGFAFYAERGPRRRKAVSLGRRA
jgi:hypothetical protein